MKQNENTQAENKTKHEKKKTRTKNEMHRNTSVNTCSLHGTCVTTPVFEWCEKQIYYQHKIHMHTIQKEKKKHTADLNVCSFNDTLFYFHFLFKLLNVR